MSSDKKNIVITGANKGIGLALAKHLNSKHTLHLMVRNPDSIPAELRSNNVHIYQANLDSVDSILAASAEIKKNTNKVDAIINNAGIYVEKPFADTSTEEISSTLEVNLKAPGLIIQQLIPNLKNAEAAVIINISSSSALTSPANQAIYSASKAGLSALSSSLQKELNTEGIRVTAIHLHGVNTWDDPNPRKLLHTDDVVHAVQFIISADKNCQINNLEIAAIQ